MHRSFRATVYHGPESSLKADEVRQAQFPMEAAKALAAEVSPGSIVFSGRVEHPANGIATWSFGWTGSGQRIWVYEA